FGHVFDRKQNAALPYPIGRDALSIQPHSPSTDMRKRMFDFQIFKGLVPEKSFSQKLAQPGNIPLPISQVIDEPSLCLGAGYAKCFVKGGGGSVNAKICVQYDQRLSDRLDQPFGIIARLFCRPQRSLQGIDVGKNDDYAIDTIIDSPIGANANGIPMPRFVLNLSLLTVK